LTPFLEALDSNVIFSGSPLMVLTLEEASPVGYDFGS